MKSIFDFDRRMSLAFDLYGGKWPKALTSGVMYYDGLRITRKMFNEYKKLLRS